MAMDQSNCLILCKYITIKDIILYTPTELGGLIAIVVAIGLAVQCCALR